MCKFVFTKSSKKQNCDVHLIKQSRNIEWFNTIRNSSFFAEICFAKKENNLYTKHKCLIFDIDGGKISKINKRRILNGRSMETFIGLIKTTDHNI